MESFKVEVDNSIYTITPGDDETFSVESNNGEVLVLTPDLIDTGVRWIVISGNASEELAQSIGEAIEDYEM